jgi:hypothetical protein
VTVFADSSALVKLYADEAGAEIVRSTRLFVVSALARAEVPAAIWRKHRVGGLSAADAGVLTTAFEADWYDASGPFVPIAVVDAVLAGAAALIGARSRLVLRIRTWPRCCASTPTSATRQLVRGSAWPRLRLRDQGRGLRRRPAAWVAS